MSDGYEKVLEWALSKGAKLNSRIERKVVNGVAGMYAAKPIPKGMLLASIPMDQTFQEDESFEYPENTTKEFRLVHASAKNLCQQENVWGGFANLYTLEDLRKSDSLFFEPGDIDLLGTMNSILKDQVVLKQNKFKLIIEHILSFDPTLDNESGRDAILQICLNYQTRAWGDYYFVPLLDMFNHSDQFGTRLFEKNNTLMLAAGMDYQPGQQVWINYGAKDIFLHAINYGYFDPSGTHAIDLGYRVRQTADNPFQKKLFQYLSTRYNLTWGEDDKKNIHYKLEHNKALLLDQAPNVFAIDYFRDLSFRTEEELDKKLVSALKPAPFQSFTTP